MGVVVGGGIPTGGGAAITLGVVGGVVGGVGGRFHPLSSTTAPCEHVLHAHQRGLAVDPANPHQQQLQQHQHHRSCDLNRLSFHPDAPSTAVEGDYNGGAASPTLSAEFGMLVFFVFFSFPSDDQR